MIAPDTSTTPPQEPRFPRHGVAFATGVLLSLIAIRAFSGRVHALSEGGPTVKTDLSDIAGKRVVVLVNGINHDTERFYQQLQRACDFFTEDDVDMVLGFHNDSHSKFHDFCQVLSQKLSNDFGRLPRITSRVTNDLTLFVRDLLDAGAHVVLVGHSQGCFFTSEVIARLVKHDQEKMLRVRTVSLGSPVGKHHGDRLGLNISITNASDTVAAGRSDDAYNITYETPLTTEKPRSRNHHRLETGYFAPDTEIGDAIRGTVRFCFGSISEVEADGAVSSQDSANT